jgi:hypothetical protein
MNVPHQYKAHAGWTTYVRFFLRQQLVLMKVASHVATYSGSTYWSSGTGAPTSGYDDGAWSVR